MLDSSVYDVMLRTMRNNISEPDIQVVCCGTVSYLASSGECDIVNVSLYFFDRFLLWIFYVFLSCVCYAFVRVCLYVPCGHLL